MNSRYSFVFPAALVVFASATNSAAARQLTVVSSFNPTDAGGFCGAAVDPIGGNVWVYECSGALVRSYSSSGVAGVSFARPGESANDVDLEFTPKSITLAGVALPEATLLFINGESGVADIYAVDKNTGAVLATLNTAFGVSHVVGGGYHRTRNSLFLVQDKVPGGANANLVAEVDPLTGAVLQSWATSAAGYIVNFGDLDVASNGNLMLVSSDESTIAEFTPTGTLVDELALPAGVSSLSGLALATAGEFGWVANTSGVVTRLSGLPNPYSTYCTAGTTSNGCVATMSASGLPIAGAPAGFTLNVANVEGQKQGILFYGVSGAAISPWGGGSSFLCVKAPTQRLTVTNSGGSAGLCDGVLSSDWSAFIAANPSALGAPFSAGQVVNAQAWFRDPPSAKTTSLSNALDFTLQP